MKIALVCPYSFSRPGGVKTHVLSLKEQFIKKGHHVKIIAPRNNDKEDYGKEIVLLGRSIPFPGNSSMVDISISLDQGNRSIKSFLEKEKFDIIHFHEPLVPFLSMQILSLSTSVNIATFHAYIEKSKFIEYFDPAVENFKKLLLPKINKAIAVSPLSKKYYDRYFKNGVETIPNGIDTKKFNPEVKPLIKIHNKTKILFIGRLEERKGIIYLLKAWKEINILHPETQLIIAGEGPLNKEVDQIILQNHLKSITKIGFINENELASLYNSAEIYCSPATHGESFGIVLLEAMACGIPIVAFANKGYSLILKDIAKHSLARNKSVKDLSNKINNLLDDKKLRDYLTEWGITNSKKFDWDIISDKILKVYENARNSR